MEWGSGIRSFHLSSAVYALLALGDKELSVKNWTPQLLLFSKLNNEKAVDNQDLFKFSNQLKKGISIL